MLSDVVLMSLRVTLRAFLLHSEIGLDRYFNPASCELTFHSDEDLAGSAELLFSYSELHRIPESHTTNTLLYNV